MHLLRQMFHFEIENDISGFVQDCSNSAANALELPQTCTKPLRSINGDSLK